MARYLHKRERQPRRKGRLRNCWVGRGDSRCGDNLCDTGTHRVYSCPADVPANYSPIAVSASVVRALELRCVCELHSGMYGIVDAIWVDSAGEVESVRVEMKPAT